MSNNEYIVSCDTAINTIDTSAINIYDKTLIGTDYTYGTIGTDYTYRWINSSPYTIYDSNIIYGGSDVNYKPSTKELLDAMDIKEIEQYIRNKKLEALSKHEK